MVVIKINYYNLKYFLIKRYLNNKQAKQAKSLAEFNFEIKYKSNKTNLVDSLLKRPNYKALKESQN